jgi:hypothetical protein
MQVELTHKDSKKNINQIINTLKDIKEIYNKTHSDIHLKLYIRNVMKLSKYMNIKTYLLEKINNVQLINIMIIFIIFTSKLRKLTIIWFGYNVVVFIVFFSNNIYFFIFNRGVIRYFFKNFSRWCNICF